MPMEKVANLDISPWQKGLAGGLSGMVAAVVTQPIDLIKTRLQLLGELQGRPVGQKLSTRRVSLLSNLHSIYRNEGGIAAFYRGLSASLLRQALYTTTRFAVYNQLKSSLQQGNAGSVGFFSSVVIGAPAGAMGAIVSCPADIVLVRMQADGRLPKESRRGYRNVLHGIRSIIRKEGVAQLWQGSSPLVYRAMVVTCAQFVGYENSKRLLTEHYPVMFTGDHIGTHVVSSLLAGVCTSLTASPMDVMKTRIMNSSRGASSAAAPVLYSSMWDCFIKILKHEGPLGFYKGVIPYYCRVAPHVVTMFIAYEQFSHLFVYLNVAANRRNWEPAL